MDDVIYRQHAINAIENTECELTTSDWNELVNSIKSVPSVQQWIPCSESLPNYDEEVLVDYRGKIRLASLTKNDEEYPWYFIANRFNAKLETVKAWMPLPEPYREESKCGKQPCRKKMR